MKTIRRGGPYYRVCKPDWRDCADTTYAREAGGRWNPPSAFGALYLNATLRVAAAQARHQHAGRAIGLFDLRPDRRPMLATFDVPECDVLDVVSPAAIRAVRLPATYPIDVAWAPCQRIGRRAYRDGLAGVAARSNAEARAEGTIGEELAYFDSQPELFVRSKRAFAAWYPDPFPS